MNHESKNSAVNASSRKDILVGELSARNMGNAFMHIFQPYFIAGFTVTQDKVTINALSVEYGHPMLRELTFKNSASITLLPDLYLALFAPQSSNEDDEVEAVNISLPSNPYILPKVKTRKNNDWAIETAKASNIVLKAN